MSIFSWFSTSPSTPSNADNITKKDTCYHIEGFLSCSYFHTATEAADCLSAKHPNVKVDVSAYTKQQWPERFQHYARNSIHNIEHPLLFMKVALLVSKM
ncbi:unnamed protein product [Absidia cylindrospora]